MSKTDLRSAEFSYLVLIGRQLFAVIFMLASAGHFTPAKIALAAAHGVPMATVLVPISGLIALLGGLSVLFGYRARVGGCLLVVFLVPVTLFMHNFWAAPDAATFPPAVVPVRAQSRTARLRVPVGAYRCWIVEPRRDQRARRRCPGRWSGMSPSQTAAGSV